MQRPVNTHARYCVTSGSNAIDAKPDKSTIKASTESKRIDKDLILSAVLLVIDATKNCTCKCT